MTAPDERPADPGARQPTAAQLPAVRGLFQRRVAGDDALLELAGLRFAQAGMPAELYADTPAELSRLLPHVPEHATLPTVHLNRGLDLLDARAQNVVRTFVERFAGRIAGVVVHDQASMRARVPDVVSALGRVADRGDGPWVYLEYAAGAPLPWFVDVAGGVAGFGRAGVCIDTGHVGLAQVYQELARDPGLDPPPSVRQGTLEPHADRVQQATAVALPAVLGLIRDVAGAGCATHFHLHDGHPAVADLSDHFSFLFRLPVPFSYHGVRSLAPMYGPPGLLAILTQALACLPPERLSLTLEIHQAEGRLPLDAEAGRLFRHWSDQTNAERLNYWLSVISDNHVLAGWALSAALGATAREPVSSGRTA